MPQSAVEVQPLATDEVDAVTSREHVVTKMFIDIVSLCPRSSEDASNVGRRAESPTHHRSD